MSFDIADALREGFNRTLTRNAVILMGVYAVLNILNTALGHSLNRSLMQQGILPSTQMAPTSFPLELGIPMSAVGVLYIGATLASLWLTLVGLRVFVSEETQKIPHEYVKRNLAFALGNLFVGGIVFAIAVFVGSIFFIIPGLFLLVSLYYWTIFVAVEDESFIEAFKSSWNLTKGNRIELFLLGFIVLVAVGVFNVILTMPVSLATGMVSTSAIEAVYSAIPSAITTVFTLATTAAAYKQLREL